ncbi:uncharacterized protein LOC118201900 [Stegodyphus dumicola]|uniref:uncharacterized protein LOC118201900 n=1 Tax=Stegodyphus dumicola TaxID=202533 RepID=UPI0015ACDDDE|nr:uncharacterized protein LOC118201900 [Stegodyphus dumicola]
MGFLCPITLTPKLLIQKIWLLKIGWDTNIPEDLGKEFYSWIDDLSLLSSVRIQSALDINENESLSLHTFCDASKQAYGCMIYLRKETIENVSVYFLLAKSRVSPLRKMTINRLELLSCCTGVRLAALALQTLKLDNVPRNYWTDLSTALSWVQRDDHWAPFVANRVKEIRKLSSEFEWRHIPGNSNPADIPSRGCSIKSFVKSRWWQGPEWLMKNEEEWPTSELITNEEEIMKEKRKNIISTLANINAEKWYLIYFSSYFKIVRMISWILRFINNCRHGGRNYGKTLSVEELDISEKKLLKIVQQEAFSSEEQLKGHFTFRDEEGIIRLKTKILKRHDDENFRCPIVLPSKHELVERMIQDYHLQLLHAGNLFQVLLTNIRQKVWIIKGKKTVQGVISKCVRCK